MILTWSAQDVLHAVRGRYLHPQDWQAHGVSIDSRSLHKGDLFIALKGPTFDGHDYVRAAIDAGACAAIVERQPAQVPPDAPLIFVDDTMSALQELGQTGRQRTSAKIVAVTGSVGKTSTKEQLRLMLGSLDDTFANEGSLNNQWGVPLTLARLPASCKYAIIEMGMNHSGELTDLSKQAKPHVALITNIEAVHLEHFANIEEIAKAKAEIFLGMGSSGIAVLNRDNAQYPLLLAAARACDLKKTLSFGKDTKSDTILLDMLPDHEGTTIKASVFGKILSFRIGSPGTHFALNALGALTTCAALDADILQCAAALEAFRPPLGRGVRQHLRLPSGATITLIDESYNASPASVQAAIQTLGQTTPERQGRRVAVLGDMLELGDTSPNLHADLADSLLLSRIDTLYCCGEMMTHLYNALPPSMRGAYARDSLELGSCILSDLRDGDVVMVKGSHGVHMEKVIQTLSSSSLSQKKAS